MSTLAPESRKRPLSAQHLQGEGSTKLQRPAVETCSDQTQDASVDITTASFLLGQPSSSMLDSWLEEEIQDPGGGGNSAARRIPEGIRVLLPMTLDGEVVLGLCQRLRCHKGASVVALVASEDDAQALFKAGSLDYSVETFRYEPPWYQDATKLEHLTRPVPVYTATGSPLTVWVCNLMDASFGLHSGALKGSFHRVLDQGLLAHTPPARRAAVVEKIRSYTTAPAQLLVCSSVHDPAEIESSLPGTAYSLALEEVRALYGSSSSAHRAMQVKRSGTRLAQLRLSSQQGCVYWIWCLSDNSEAAAGGQGKLRPPACPCCR